jgi:uncharacterized protein YecE (DUF72 family)
MEFGRLDTKTLNKMTFSLPADPASNKATLAKGKGHTKVYLGCAKWGRKEWIGKIYPKGTKESQFLDHYIEHYNSLELNATNYKMYSPQDIEKWAAKAGNKLFKFCPKAHRAMGFYKVSEVGERVTQDFFASIRHFGKHLGPVFITHDERIKFHEDVEEGYFRYLASFSQDLDYFVEERHPDFFADKKRVQHYADRLREMGIGAIITDAAGRQDALHMQLTTPKAFIRFTGNSLHKSDFPRIDQWAARLKKWMDQGLEEFYFFMHMHDEALSPELTQYVVDSFNKKCKLDLPDVKFVDGFKMPKLKGK